MDSSFRYPSREVLQGLTFGVIYLLLAFAMIGALWVVQPVVHPTLSQAFGSESAELVGWVLALVWISLGAAICGVVEKTVWD